MTPEQIESSAKTGLELADKYGVGTVLLFVFVAAFFVFLWKGGKWAVQFGEKMHDTMTRMLTLLEVIKGNHLHGIEESGKETVKMLSVLNQIVGMQGTKLDRIEENTKKPQQ